MSDDTQVARAVIHPFELISDACAGIEPHVHTNPCRDIQTTDTYASVEPYVRRSEIIEAPQVGMTMRLHDAADVERLAGCTIIDMSQSNGTYRLGVHKVIGHVSDQGTACMETAYGNGQEDDWSMRDVWKLPASVRIVRITEAHVTAQHVRRASLTCSTCMGAKVLRHIVPGMADEPCPDCPPAPMQGPSEWTITKQRRRSLSNPLYGEVIEIEVAKDNQHWTGCITAYDSGTQVYAERYGEGGTLVRAACVQNERALNMAISRLLCGLRDGSIQP